jgi:hypothetical protein
MALMDTTLQLLRERLPKLPPPVVHGVARAQITGQPMQSHVSIGFAAMTCTDTAPRLMLIHPSVRSVFAELLPDYWPAIAAHSAEAIRCAGQRFRAASTVAHNSEAIMHV